MGAIEELTTNLIPISLHPDGVKLMKLVLGKSSIPLIIFRVKVFMR